MRRLLVVSALALSIVIALALFQPADWAFEAGVFYAFLAALAVIAALAANSVIARRRGVGQTGPFGPGLLTVTQTFWTTMAIALGLGCLILQLDSSGHGTDSYTVGIGAFLPQAAAVLAALLCLAFLLNKRWAWRLTLTALSACSAAFACMAVTWWLIG